MCDKYQELNRSNFFPSDVWKFFSSTNMPTHYLLVVVCLKYCLSNKIMYDLLIPDQISQTLDFRQVQ